MSTAGKERWRSPAMSSSQGLARRCPWRTRLCVALTHFCFQAEVFAELGDVINGTEPALRQKTTVFKSLGKSSERNDGRLHGALLTAVLGCRNGSSGRRVCSAGV